jgi:predicted oxidoreductase
MKLTLPGENLPLAKWHKLAVKQLPKFKRTKATVRERARTLRHALRKTLHPKHAQLAKGISQVAATDIFRDARNITGFKMEMNALIVYLNARKCPLPQGVDNIEAIIAERKKALEMKYAEDAEAYIARHATTSKADQLQQAAAAEPVKAGSGFTQVH